MDRLGDRAFSIWRSCRLVVLLPFVLVASCAGSGERLDETTWGGLSNEAAMAEEQYEEMEREANR